MLDLPISQLKTQDSRFGHRIEPMITMNLEFLNQKNCDSSMFFSPSNYDSRHTTRFSIIPYYAALVCVTNVFSRCKTRVWKNDNNKRGGAINTEKMYK